MSDWPLFSIDEIASQHKNALATGPFGSSIGTSTFRTTGVPLIRGSNLSADVSTRLIEDEFVFVDEDLARKFDRSIASLGDIVFTCWGTINQVGIIDKGASFDRYLVSNKQMKLTVDTRKALPLYVYYFFSGPAGQAEIDMGAIGSSVPGFNLTKLRKIKIPLPSMYVQRKIVDILDGLDNKVQLNRQMNETLEATARAIFRDWFIDFGPTRAKMAGTKPYLAPENWDLFPDSLDDKGKPRGWEDQTISKLADLNPESWSRANYPVEIRYVDLANTKWGTIESTELHTAETAPSRAQRIIRPGDTIMGTVRPGNGSYALIDDEGFTASTGFAVLRPKLPSHREIVYLSLTMPENIDRLSHLADGGAYPAVRPEVIAATEIMIAPSSVILHFSDIVAPLIDRMEANKRENSILAKTRDILLPKLMSGEIRIPALGSTAQLVLEKAR